MAEIATLREITETILKSKDKNNEEEKTRTKCQLNYKNRETQTDRGTTR